MCTWLHEMRVAAEDFQRPAILGSTLKEVFESVGFVDVQQVIFKMPMNPWPKDERLKEIGRMWGENFSQGLNGFSIQLMNKVFGRTPAEIEVSTRAPMFFLSSSYQRRRAMHVLAGEPCSGELDVRPFADFVLLSF